MTRPYDILLVGALLALPSCREQRRPSPRQASPDARPSPPRRGPPVAAPRPVSVSASQRVYDRRHRATLQKIVRDLDRLYTDTVALQARGVREPAFQDHWPHERERLVSRAGRVRAQVLAVDPLSTHSWAAGRASVLLRYLTVRLPDAIRESWRTRPSGAFVTWRSDFRLIWGRLRRYVESQLKKQSRRSSKDTP